MCWSATAPSVSHQPKRRGIITTSTKGEAKTKQKQSQLRTTQGVSIFETFRNLQPPTEKNGMVTALKSKAQELSFAFKSGNHTILLCRWL